MSQGELVCIVAIQAKMVSSKPQATGDPMGMHTTKVAVGEGKFALEAQLTVTPQGISVSSRAFMSKHTSI